MTAFIPSTRVTIQRGIALPNTYGDELPSLTEIATGVPACVTEGTGSASGGSTSQRTWQPNEDRAGVLEEYTVRLRPGTDVLEDDRLLDERTGAVYQVRVVYNPQFLVGLADVRTTAVRTGAASLPVNG